jgi:hypothetical protein
MDYSENVEQGFSFPALVLPTQRKAASPRAVKTVSVITTTLYGHHCSGLSSHSYWVGFNFAIPHVNA